MCVVCACVWCGLCGGGCAMCLCIYVVVCVCVCVLRPSLNLAIMVYAPKINLVLYG